MAISINRCSLGVRPSEMSVEPTEMVNFPNRTCWRKRSDASTKLGTGLECQAARRGDNARHSTVRCAYAATTPSRMWVLPRFSFCREGKASNKPLINDPDGYLVISRHESNIFIMHTTCVHVFPKGPEFITFPLRVIQVFVEDDNGIRHDSCPDLL